MTSTAAPLHMAVQHPADAKRLLENMSTGVDLAPYIIAFRHTPMAKYVRRCTCCAEEDIGRYGFAFARVFHQFRPIWRCDVHNIPLEERCAACDQPFHAVSYLREERFRHQITKCESCGCSAGQAISARLSPAYVEFAEAIKTCMRNPSNRFRPEARLPILQQLLEWAAETETDLNEELCKWWMADTLEEACAAACLEVKLVRRVFAGRSLPIHPYAVVALVTFAEHVLEARMFGGIEVGPPRVPIARNICSFWDNYRFEVCKVAAEHGIPHNAALKISDGAGFNVLSRLGFGRELFDSLPDLLPAWLGAELREKRKTMRFSRGQFSSNEWEEVRAYRRIEVLKLLEIPGMTRSRLSQKSKDLWKWFNENDTEWFASVLPQYKNRHSKVDQREKVLKILANGKTHPNAHGVYVHEGKPVHGRGLLRRVDSALDQWMRTSDREWYYSLFSAEGVEMGQHSTEVVAISRPMPPNLIGESANSSEPKSACRSRPSRASIQDAGNFNRQVHVTIKRLSQAEKLARAREALLALKAQGVSSRGEVRQLQQAAYDFLRKHSQKDLQQIFPSKRRMATEETRHENRAAISELLRAGVRNRAELSSRGRFYSWARRHDRAWLDEHLPDKRRKGATST